MAKEKTERLEGEVTKITFKEKEEDNYGNKYQPIVSLDSGEKLVFNLAKAKRVSAVSYENNGFQKYLEIEEGDVIKVDAVPTSKEGLYKAGAKTTHHTGDKAKQPKGKGGSGGGGYKGKFNNNTERNLFGTIAGHAVTNAINLLSATLKSTDDLDDEEVEKLAVRIVKVTDKVEAQVKSLKEKKKSDVDDFLDDDDDSDEDKPKKKEKAKPVKKKPAKDEDEESEEESTESDEDLAW